MLDPNEKDLKLIGDDVFLKWEEDGREVEKSESEKNAFLDKIDEGISEFRYKNSIKISQSEKGLEEIVIHSQPIF